MRRGGDAGGGVTLDQGRCRPAWPWWTPKHHSKVTGPGWSFVTRRLGPILGLGRNHLLEWHRAPYDLLVRHATLGFHPATQRLTRQMTRPDAHAVARRVLIAAPRDPCQSHRFAIFLTRGKVLIGDTP